MSDTGNKSLDFDESEDDVVLGDLPTFPKATIAMQSDVEDIAVENNVGIGAELLQSVSRAGSSLRMGKTAAYSGKTRIVDSAEIRKKPLIGRRESIGIAYSVSNLDAKMSAMSVSPGSNLVSAFNATAALLGVPEGTEMEEKLGELENELNEPFEAAFEPTEMRQLALVAHNHMKPAMKAFIESHSEILKKFRITGTNTTITMCKSVFGDDPNVVYGATCSSGPLGGDAQLAAIMALEDIGGIIFFIDPLSAHPHQADIDSLVRLANVCNVLLVTNPATAESVMYLLQCALKKGKKAMFPSFFQTLESPAVPEYKAEQKRALQKAIDS